MFAGLPAEVETVVCGHTHMRGAGAWWALLGPGVQLRRTRYDVEAVCARVATGSTFPDAAAWADGYLRSRHSDVDALVALGPRDGR